MIRMKMRKWADKLPIQNSGIFARWDAISERQLLGPENQHWTPNHSSASSIRVSRD